MGQMTSRKTLELLRNRYALNLPVRISKLQECMSAALSGAGGPGAGEVACRAVHSLIGSSGTYGFPELSHLAGRVELRLKESLDEEGRPSAQRQAELTELMALMETQAALAASGSKAQVA